MIIGLDHVALNVADIDEASAKLLAKNYENKFTARNLDNSETKRPLLGAYRAGHSIAYFARPPSIPIELTCHGTEQGRLAAKIDYLDDRLRLKVADVTGEATFWRDALGFSAGGDDTISFNAMLPQWRCRLRLVEDKQARPSMLDDNGYTCIALLVNDMDRDIQRVNVAGSHQWTDVFTHEVNGRTMRIAMFRTPGDIIVELIEINKK